MRRLAPLVVALGCEGTGGPAVSDTPASDTPSAVDPCAARPILAWANFGEGFLLENCQSCHASTAADRRGAPADVVFDSLEATLPWRERILARSVGDSPTMPPAGGVAVDDRVLLEAWLTCGVDARPAEVR